MNIKEFLKKLKKSSWFQKMHILNGFIITALMNVLGVNIVFAVFFGLFAGLIKELLHCYSPMKKVSVLGLKFDVVDWERLKVVLMNLNITAKHQFDSENYIFNVVGVVAYILLKIIVLFI